MADNENGIQVVTQEHAIYTKMKYLWQFYMDSYQGGYRYRENAGGSDSGMRQYLFPHESESDKSGKYEERRIRSFYDNWCKMPINLYLKYVFSDRYPIERVTDKSEIFDPYISNLNLRKKDVDTFMRFASRNKLIFGEYNILVDRPPLPESVRSKADENNLGIRSYVTGISPLQLTNWSINPYTREYDWIVIRTVDYKNSDWRTYNNSQVTRYYLWTKDEIYYTNEGGDPLPPSEMPIPGTPNPMPNKLGFIPLIKMVYSDIDEDGFPESFLMDIAEINRSIYNIDSMYDEELYKLCFSQLLKQKSTKNYTEYETQSNQEALSVDRIMEFDEGTAAPSYLIPAVEGLVEKRARKNELIQGIMRMANLGGQAGVTPETFQSGVAMSFAYSDTHLTAAQIAGQAEEAEKQIWELIRLWDDIKPEIKIEYPKKFDIRSDMENRENYKIVKDYMGKSPTIQVAADIREAKRILEEEEPFWKKSEDELLANYETGVETEKAVIRELQPGEEQEIVDQGIINTKQQSTEEANNG